MITFEKRRMTCGGAGVLLAASLLAGCGAGMETPAEEVNGTTEALTTVLSENFETTPLGPLGSPWFVTRDSSNASTVNVVNTADHGRALQLHGGTALGAFLIAQRGFSSSASDITAAFDINPAAGSAFVWSLDGAGSSIGARRVRLQRAPGSTTLVAQTSPSGSTNCGTLASGVWTRLTLVVHTQSSTHTFDVQINGAATACTGIATGLSAPFNGITIMDASNEGWGGNVLFDNILVTGP